MKINKYIVAGLGIVLAGGLITGLMLNCDEGRCSKKSQKAVQKQEAEESGRAALLNYSLRVDPTDGKFHAEHYYRALQAINNMAAPHALNLNWEEMGPDNIGGRTRAILIDTILCRKISGNPKDKVIYASGVTGGLFYANAYTPPGTKFSGLNWRNLDSAGALGNGLVISCMTQTPSGDIFYGTGEEAFQFANGSALGTFPGTGIYHSSDGKTFKLLSKTNPTSAGQAAFQNVSSMGADVSSDRIYAGTDGGVYYSDNKGTSWTRASGSNSPSGRVMELKVDRNGVIYASGPVKVWKSSDKGQTWKDITPSKTTTSARMAIGVSYSDPNYIYVMGAKASDARLLSIWQSTDAGNNWTVIGNGGAAAADFDPLALTQQGQGVYDNVIAVDPEDPGRVFAAGVNWWEWQDPATHKGPKVGWRKTAEYGSNFSVDPRDIHADKHAIVFDLSTNPYTTYIGSDGGITVSTDKCVFFGESNKNLATIQFYGIAADPNGRVLGGTQDNNTLMITGKGNTKGAAVPLLGGDGGYCEISRRNPNILFMTSPDGNLVRSRTGGPNPSRIYDCKMINLLDSRYGYGASRKCEDKTNEFNSLFVSPITLKEDGFPLDSSLFAMGFSYADANGAAQYAIFATYQATNLTIQGAPAWYKIANISGNPKCLAVSNDNNSIFVGTDGGNFYRVTGLKTASYDTSLNWNYANNGISVERVNFGGSGLPANQTLTSIAVDAKNSNHIVLTYGNYNRTTHIYESTNINDTLANIRFKSIQGNLPDMPVFSAVIHNDNPKVIIAGTEFGVFGTDDGGITWTENNKGMARVPVYQIRQYEDHPWAGPVFYAGTYGRGIFKCSQFVTSTEKVQATSPLEVSVFPNPASDYLQVRFMQTQKGQVNVRMIGLNGQQAFQQDMNSVTPGSQQFVIPTANLSAGIYLVYVESGQRRYTSKVLIAH